MLILEQIDESQGAIACPCCRAVIKKDEETHWLCTEGYFTLMCSACAKRVQRLLVESAKMYIKLIYDQSLKKQEGVS